MLIVEPTVMAVIGISISLPTVVAVIGISISFPMLFKNDDLIGEVGANLVGEVGVGNGEGGGEGRGKSHDNGLNICSGKSWRW